MVCAGQCKHKFSIETVERTRTDDGGFTEAYEHSFYTKGSLLGLAGKEYFDAAQTQGSGTFKIVIRQNTNTRAMTIRDRMVTTKKGVTTTLNLLSILPDPSCRDFIIMAVVSLAETSEVQDYQTSDGEDYQTADGQDFQVGI